MLGKKLNIIFLLYIVFLTGCNEEPPVVPGLTDGSIVIVSEPAGASIIFNNRETGLFTPAEIENLEPGFYKISLKLTTYLDTVVYSVVNRNNTDTLVLEMRENPEVYWNVFNTLNSDLPINTVTKILTAPDGSVWLATGGRGIVNFKNGVFTNYNVGNSGLGDNFIQDLAFSPTGELWIAGSLGIYRFDGSNFVSYTRNNSNLPDDYVKCITFDKTGKLWAGTFYGGLVRLDDTGFTVFDTSNSELPNNKIMALLIDNKGDLIIGTWGSGLVQFNLDSFKVYDSFTFGLVSDYISTLAMNKGGEIWLGYSNVAGIGVGGVGRFFYKGITNYTFRDSDFKANVVTDIAIAENGAVWITSADKGLYKFEGGVWKNYNSLNSGIGYDVAVSIDIDSDNIKWIAAGGLVRYSGGK